MDFISWQLRHPFPFFPFLLFYPFFPSHLEASPSLPSKQELKDLQLIGSPQKLGVWRPGEPSGHQAWNTKQASGSVSETQGALGLVLWNFLEPLMQWAPGVGPPFLRPSSLLSSFSPSSPASFLLSLLLFLSSHFLSLPLLFRWPLT